MPEVTVRYVNSTLTSHTAKMLAAALQTIVAEALNVPGDEHGEITKNDIVVRFVAHNPFDIGVMNFEIDIVTVDIPARRKNLQERTEAIANKVRALTKDKDDGPTGTHGYVWIILTQSGFKTF
ncbi:MAG: hypothetical protein ABIO57_01490 [Candidatus Paceibacterota bacterium]